MREKFCQKNATEDWGLGLLLVRDETAADSGAKAPSDPMLPASLASIGAAFPKLSSGMPSGLVAGNGARTIRWRFFVKSSDATSTVRVKLYEWHYPTVRAIDTATGIPTRGTSRGSLILDYTLTFNGSTTANIHPVTGEAVSSSTFYEAGTLTTVNSHQSNRVRLSSSAATGELSILTDIYGAGWLYPLIGTLGGTTASRIIVAAQWID